MTDIQASYSAIHSWLVGASVGRRVVTLAAAIAALTCMVVVSLQAFDRVRGTYGLQDRNDLGISSLLAGQIGGAVRWGKGDVVEATFAPIVKQANSNLASLLSPSMPPASHSSITRRRALPPSISSPS